MTDIARIIPVIRVNYEKFRTADEMADMIVRYSWWDTRVCGQFVLCVITLPPPREYGKMASVRYVDFDTPAKKVSTPVRSNPELVSMEN